MVIYFHVSKSLRNAYWLFKVSRSKTVLYTVSLKLVILQIVVKVSLFLYSKSKRGSSTLKKKLNSYLKLLSNYKLK